MTVQQQLRTPHYRRRQMMDQLMRGLTVVATGLALIPLVLIIGYVLIVGGSVLNWEFFTQAYRAPVVGVGTTDIQAAGGVAHGIIGTVLITGTALLLSIPIGVLAGVFLSEYDDTPLSNPVRFCTDVLSAAPSIVVGVVGYILIVLRFGSYSGFAGSVALTFLMVPTIVRTTEEILKLVPDSVREAATALGAPKWHVTLFVVIPAAGQGIITGIMLAFARGAGETAPLLLTTIGANIITTDMGAQMAALPLLAYRYIGSPFPAEQQLAWGAAFVLTVLVLTTNILVRWATRDRTARVAARPAYHRVLIQNARKLLNRRRTQEDVERDDKGEW
jgi:phosphate transport system permease protein